MDSRSPSGQFVKGTTLKGKFPEPRVNPVTLVEVKPCKRSAKRCPGRLGQIKADSV